MSAGPEIYVLAVLDDRPASLKEVMARLDALCKVLFHLPFTEQGVERTLEGMARRRLAVECPGGWRKGSIAEAKAYRDEVERVREMRRKRFEAQGRRYYFEADPIAAEENDRMRARFKAPDKLWRSPL